ncbi:MAG: histidinol dehydrogenase [Ginsengibacter sp.]
MKTAINNISNNKIKLDIQPSIRKWNDLIARPYSNNEIHTKKIKSILKDVRINGDKALKKYTFKFDGVRIDNLKVTVKEINESVEMISPELKKAILHAKKNIELFHEAQKEKSIKIKTDEGVTCWRKSVPIEKVGLYIPGGNAPLFSTLLMLAIPAMAAGCREIIITTPPAKDGTVHPALLYVCKILGLQNIYKVGGAQAIAAMAYGTETIPSVYKIFGPGNQFVSTAKQLVNQDGIAIDLIAGPSELAVYADESCIPQLVAADLLSQAEHGPDSQVILVASTKELATEISEFVDDQMQVLPRKHFIEQSLKNSKFIVLKKAEDAFKFLNLYAPEHLIIASEKAITLSEMVINAGSVFIGNFSSESAGDYATGTNHTLPTSGFAKTHSGVSLDSFVKKITFQEVTKKGISTIGKTVQTLAESEGLDAHAAAITTRLKYLNKKL